MSPRRFPMTGAWWAALLGVAFAAAASAQPAPSWFDPTRVDDTPVAPPARTVHQGVFNGTPVRYEALAGEWLLDGADGQPAATMFSTAYVRMDVAKTQRPVLFVFNGGPGASSSPLHLGIGPVRRSKDDADAPLVPNPVSPLDATDLVFIDPVGTGFTRLFSEGAGEAYWGIEADADSVLYLIGQWLARHGREQSPVYVMGESYGGTRAAVVAARAEKVDIDGLMLISPALDFSAGAQVVGNNLPYVALLPSMAVTAVYHGAVDRAGRSDAEIFDAAARFAVGEYAAALNRGNTIDAERKAAVAKRVAAMTGLDEAWVRDANLRIDRNEFSDRLLAADGLRVGRLDARVTGAIEEYRDKRPPGNDPSMGGGNRGERSTGELLAEYFTGPLAVPIERPYRTLNLDLNQKWDYGHRERLKTYISVLPQLQSAMQAKPTLRVYIGGGMYDMGTPIMAARYAASQVDVDPGRFTFSGFAAGHTVTDDEAARAALCDDVRTFVAGPALATTAEER